MASAARSARDWPDGNLKPTGNQTDVDLWAQSMTSAVYLYYTPLLVLLGCVGNLLSVFVFFTSRLRLQSASVYLSALTLSDTVFLLQLLPPWLSAVGATDAFVRRGWCQVVMYAAYASSSASAWFVVAFTAERLVAVLYPLRRSAVCTVERARLATGAVALLALAFNAPVLWFAAPREGQCSLQFAYLAPATSFNIADTVLSCSVPLLIIVVGNALIVCYVRLSAARRAAPPDDSRSQRRLTKMLLTVSTVFFCCNVPAYVFRIYAYIQNSAEVGERWIALQMLAVLLFQTNSAINFCLYCMIGQNFRRALFQAVPGFRRLQRRPVLVRRPTPRHACSVTNLSIGSFESHSRAPAPLATTSSAAGPPLRDTRDVKARFTFARRGQRCTSTAGSLESHGYNERTLSIISDMDSALPKRDQRDMKARFGFYRRQQSRIPNSGSYESHLYNLEAEASTSSADATTASPQECQGSTMMRWVDYNRRRWDTPDSGADPNNSQSAMAPGDNRNVKTRWGFTTNGQGRGPASAASLSGPESVSNIEMSTFNTTSSASYLE